MTSHESESGYLTTEQQTGVLRLCGLLPILATYYDPSDSDERDVCRACHSCECGGGCPAAMEIVRQVIEDLGCGDDSWEWWLDYFKDGA